MGFIKFLKICVYITVMMLGLINLAESIILVHFDRAPPARTRFTTAIFQYTVKKPDGFNECRYNGCSIHCELDGQALDACPAHLIVLKNLTVNVQHNFVIQITTWDGDKNSSVFSWFIDTTPPTATIFSPQIYTNAEELAIDVTFSEPCIGNGGFKCRTSSNCNILVDGPAEVQASSLQSITPNIKYRINLIFSSKNTYGRVIVRMENKFCTDDVGNRFTRTNGSILIIHLDKRALQGDLWTSIPSYVMAINGVPRTVLATNKEKDLDIFLDFLSPVSNSTEQILSALHVNSGKLIPIQSQDHGSRRFTFRITNISRTDIITVELRAASVISRTGTRMSPVVPISLLYDSSNPSVRLSTSSPNVTKKSQINVIVEFTKPVFGFESSMVIVNNGILTRFERLSRALYSLTVMALPDSVVSISVPADKVNDISGNLNMASNKVEVEHYSVPAISVALHSFVTAGVLATSFAASVLAISSSNLEAVDTLAIGRSGIVTSGPSSNLHGMIGHLQVFVLSDWLSDYLPIVYSETTKGLGWLIPRQNLPWKDGDTSMWPNHFYMPEEKLTLNFSGLSIEYPSHGKLKHPFSLNSTNSSCLLNGLFYPPELDSKLGWLNDDENKSMKIPPYGKPLNSKEYFTYFLRGEPLSASNVDKKMENNKGWQDMEINLFWLGAGGGSLITSHLLILKFLKWRIKTPDHGILSVPRFELFLLILALPCISQSSTFVIRGGSKGGIIAGAVLLAVPAALILSATLFLVVVIFSTKLVQYKEIQFKDRKRAWFKKLCFFFVGRPTTGQWFYKEGIPSFLKPYGILFDNRKGPPLYMFIDQNDPNNVPKWTESTKSGIGRMRAISSDDSSKEPNKVPTYMRILGCVQSSYIIIDLTRRVGLGILSGSYSTRKTSQGIVAMIITIIQFLYLFSFKPYITRGIHVAESLSLLSEAGLFGISTYMKNSNPMKEKVLGYVMLALLLVTFVSHAINEWYSLIQGVKRLSEPKKNSLKLGLKCVIQGLILPLTPRDYWSSIIPKISQPTTGLASVLPLSPDTAHERTSARINSTVVPVLSPGSLSPNFDHGDGSMITTEATMSTEEQKCHKLEPKIELKKLRELAKASFSSKVEEGSTSYVLRDHSEITQDTCQLSSSKNQQ